MSVVAKGGGKDYAQPPVGVHPGLCVDVIDLGDILTPFKDKAGRPKKAHQISVVWQIQPEDEQGKLILRDDGRPFRVSRYYTLSLNEKANLRADLESWRGKPFTEEDLEQGFDVEKLLLKPCQLTLVSKLNQKNKPIVVVKSISPPHRKDPKIEVDPLFKRELEIPGGRDMRSPPKDDSDEPEEPTEPDIEDDDLPF